MTIDNNAGSLTENIIACIEALGGARPSSLGLQELWQAFAEALNAFSPGTPVLSVVAGTNVTVDDTDPQNPVVSATGSGGGGVESVTGSTSISVNNSDPDNPVISRPALTGDITSPSNSNATTLKNTGPGATGPIGDGTHVAQITIDAQGRVTALASVSITGGGGGGNISLLLASLVSVDSSEVTSHPPSGAATVDGIAVTTGLRVFLNSQTDDEDNGIWIANTAGAWTRPSDYATGTVIPGGTMVALDGTGDNYFKSLWILGPDVTVGTSSAGDAYSMIGGVTLMQGDATLNNPPIFDTFNSAGAQMAFPTSDPGGTGFVWSDSGVLVLSGSTAPQGTVTSVAVASTNGFGGTVAGTSTQTITIKTSVTGILHGNGTAVAAAIASDFPTLNQNTTGTAANLSGTPALPNGTTATTQSAHDNSTKLATTAYADAAGGGSSALTQIANTVLGSAAASITFSAIPGTFNHLKLDGMGRSANGAGVDEWTTIVNGVTTNYDSSIFGQFSSTPSAGQNVAAAAWTISGAGADLTGGTSTAGVASGYHVELPFYALTTLQKTIIQQSGFADGALTTMRTWTLMGGNRSTTAITSVTIATNSGSNLVAGTAMTLYGLT